MAVSARAPRFRFSRTFRVIGLACGAVLLASCGGAHSSTESATASDDDGSTPGDADTDTIDNCGVDVPLDGAPERVVTMNQAATEVMLALGLEDRLVGTAYLDDEILPEYADAYASVPVLADEYPSTETLLDAEPDAVYAAYSSAFDPEHAGDRSELAELGILSYLSPSACPETPSDEPLDIELVWQEIREIGTIFGVSERADELIAEQEDALKAAVPTDDGRPPPTVMWWDGGSDAPRVGACCGAPGMMMDAAGAENVFGDIDGSWTDVSWEQVVERDPDVIVLIDAEWSPADEKRDVIASTPAVSELPAVREQRFVEVPFSATTPGVRNAGAIVDLAEELEVLR
ncbi:putative F420-0 ABC transporter substrate-binding protein [Actinobacteria bacterium YIM 96077]|uniref:Putative F420-0 ABC transporter substrate-binding protein n=1 Tax=Phytoactinopolyspora halophila TaxID=1981511 RepID=A0A329QP73_9ACTN|nr:ABC transporter substrate-binding protein [Phytoactinopolyspora halophila]AYY15058.1 putative F420-0 ABC transporter substrate-binding protein [Actinobacteria bacterium YIM 96077]RAW14177.1 putative F420-0 ABC transporter substrate-binding protein [Phytoactinopolyspora halophila]